MTRRTVTMPALHAGQDEIRRHPARFKAVPCGRRWGKSKLVQALLFGNALERQLPGWWIWPTLTMAQEAWHEDGGLLQSATKLKDQGLPLTISKTDYTVRLDAGGGGIAMRSADHPERLVAAGLGLAVFDESGLHRVPTWDESVRPACADHQSPAVFVGVPKGRQGLLWHAHQLGLDETADEWATFPHTTWDNPLFPKAERAALEADHAAGRVSDRYFKQEYLAAFLGDHGAVFENVVSVATATEPEHRPDGAYIVVGIDWGRTNDATVFSAGNLATDPPSQVALERIVGRSYDEQKRRLADFCEKWKPDLLIPERNSMGGPLCEELAQRYELLYQNGEPGFYMHAGSKRPLIENYAHAFRTGGIAILPDATQVTEHQAYEVKQLSTGHMTYSAPKNEHDDTVIAGALWYSAVDDGGAFGMIVL